MIETVELHSDGLRLAAQLYLPEEGLPPFPAVIICHGLGSRGSHHAEFAAFLNANGWAALTFDFRGHGESEGWLDENTVHDVAAAGAYLLARPEVDCARLAVRGSSMGGHYAVHAAAILPYLRAAVAICPAPEDLLQRAFEDAVGPACRETPYWESPHEDDRFFRLAVPGYLRYLERSSLIAAARSLSPRGLMIVHAKGDQTIDYHRSEELFAAAGEPKRLLLLEDGNHGSAQHDPLAHRAVLEWLNRVV